MGLYGSSRSLISSADSLTSAAASVFEIMSFVAPRRKRKRRRPVLGTALTDQFFQFVKGRGADDGRSDD